MEPLHGLHRDGMSKDERFHWIGWVRSVLSPYLTGWTSIPRHWGFHPTIGCFPGIRRSLRDITNIKLIEPLEPVASLVKFLSMASNGESRLVQARGVWGERNFAALERWVHVNEQSCGPVITSTELILFVYLAMDWNLWYDIFLGDEQPFISYFDIFRYSPGDPKVLTHPIFHRGIILLTLSGSSTARAGCCTGWKLQTLVRGIKPTSKPTILGI
jgi:hypothetical protein